MTEEPSGNRISRRRFLGGTAAVLAGTLLPTKTGPGRSPALSAAGTRGPQPAAATGPIIADHTVVVRYQDIPQPYLDLVKRMWANIPGESHSCGCRIGCRLLEGQDSRYAVNVTESGPPEAYTDQHLRLSRATWGDLTHNAGWIYGYGEEDWYTSAQAIAQTKRHLTECHSQGLVIAATGFGWCWDMTWHNSPDGGIDPVHQVRWAGSSVGGPEGDLPWGLDAADSALTGNSVCMDTYLNAVEQYIAHCKANAFSTRVFYTTGPVDGGGNTGESGYQRYLKHEYIRDYVRASSDGILFDYADILTWGDDGVQNTTTWVDHGGTERVFPFIHDDNMLDLDGSYTEDGDHIGERGALRLAKALWWMLGRLAGCQREVSHRVYLPSVQEDG